MIAVASFAIAGAVQKDQPKKSATNKTVAKKSPTPAKKSASSTKPSSRKKGPDKKTASGTKKQPDKKKDTSKKPTTAKSKTDVKKPSPSKNNAKTTTTKDSPKRPPVAKAKTTVNKTSAKAKPVPEKPAAPKKNDKADLEKALALTDSAKKVAALGKFLTDHPRSDLRPRAFESLTAARVALGEAKFEAGEREAGTKLFRQAIAEAPVPYPEKLFNEVISKVPPSLLYRGETIAALEMAAAIEKNSSASISQLLSLANFHLSIENGDDAKRLADAAIKLDENSAAAYQTLGMAHRLNFDLEPAAEAFAKAVELEPASVISRRSLADMKRALGKPDEALAIYAGLIEKDADDVQAQTGRVLALFGAGKRVEAEVEMARSLEANSGNFVLLAGAAYWYATVGENAKTVDLAGKAIAAEPRYIWSHIALARGFSGEGRLAEAEQVLLRARKYGNFPTLEYEIALVRFASGFYREAAEELQRSFVVKDGMLTTRLGRRIERSERSFTDLLAYERRASILEPSSADNVATAEQLKILFEFRAVLDQPEPLVARASELADAFARGSDKMRYHRQIYAAGSLAEKKIAPEKALELTKTAIASVDDGLAIPVPAGPVMASELYESRTVAMASDRYVVVPDVPKQTLSAIARGRIEEIAGWSLLLQGNRSDAVTRLKRAVNVLPEKSAWWRSSLWRLGTALEADGKDKDALDAYVKSYASADPTFDRYSTIRSVYLRINGGTDGLDALIGPSPAKPVDTAAQAQTVSVPNADPAKATEKTGSKNTESSETATDNKKLDEIKTPEDVSKPSTDQTAREVKKPEAEKDSAKTDPQVKTTDETVKESPTDPAKQNGKEPSPTSRPRIVEGKEIVADAPAPCAVNVSQENVSIIAGAGSVGILASVAGNADSRRLTATASSPKDLEVIVENENVGGLALFVIRSLTSIAGVYQVTFEAPCGKKDVVVKVR